MKNRLLAAAASAAVALVLSGCTGGTYDGYVHAECDPTETTEAGEVTTCRVTDMPVPTETVTVTAEPSATPTQTATPTPTPTETATVSPLAPQNIRKDPAFTETNTSVRFIWDAVPGNTTYKHYLNGTIVEDEVDENTGETFVGLTSGTTYQLVVSSTVDGVEHKSAPVSFTTGGTTGTPAPTSTSTPTSAPVTPLAPTVETVTYPGASGDVADDMAVYADGNDSVVIGADKSDAGGLAVFDMKGKILQYLAGGKMANIDLRKGFMLGGQPITLVSVNDRSNDTLKLFKYDPGTRSLSRIDAGSVPTFAPNYGGCMYKSAVSGKYYAFVTPKVAGNVQQFELKDNGAGRVSATLVREMPVSGITEACVADDEKANLYVSVEQTALYKYGAEPGTGTTRTRVGSAGDGNLVADIEGVGIAKRADGSGQIIVSSQGDSRFVVYDRNTNAFVKKFNDTSNGDIDSVDATDGVEVSTENMGPGFEQGIFIAHDEFNAGASSSNLKFYPLQAILP